MAFAPPRIAPQPRPELDPTHYPVDDDMGEGVLHRLIVELLRPLVAEWLAKRGVTAFVGASQFIYWVQYEPTASVAPDVYVLPSVEPSAVFGCWKVWETGIVPSFALEVVSRDVTKDYEIGPRRYEALGVRELVVFDPEHHLSPERARWQLFRRRGRGPSARLALAEATNRDRVRSPTLGCFLRSVGDGARLRVRIATGARGERLLPTPAEVAEAAKTANARLRARLDARSSRRAR